MKNFVNILARVYAPTSFSSENRVELTIKEGIKNPEFPQANNTFALFKPSTEVHMKKSTLDFLLLTQGKEVRFGEKDKVVEVMLENIPAEFLKGYKKSGQRYYGIKANLSTEPTESHCKWFFTDDMSVKMCEKFITEHKFIESQEVLDDEENETEEDE